MDMTALIKEKRKDNTIQEKTLKSYVSMIDKVIGDKQYEKLLTDVEDNIKWVNDNYDNYGTRNKYFRALSIGSSCINDEGYEKAGKKYWEEADKNKELNEVQHKTNGNLTNNQLENYTDLDAIIEVINNIDTKKDRQLYIITKMLSLNAIRNEIATITFIRNSYYKKLQKKNNNYLVRHNNTFYLALHDYKTSDTYGENIIPLTDPELLRVIKTHLKDNKIDKTNDPVFLNNKGEGLSANNLSKLLTRYFEDKLGKKISTTIIRKAMISKHTIDTETWDKINSLAKTMGHSVSIQQNHYNTNVYGMSAQSAGLQ